MDHESAALIDARVQSARCGLAQSVGALEHRVTDTVRGAMDTVQQTSAVVRQTADSVIDDVRTAWDSAANGVREALNVRQRVRANPWTSLGLSAAAGFMAGFLPRAGNSARWTNATGRPGIWQTLGESLRRELVGVGETAIAAAGAAFRTNVEAMAMAHRAAADNQSSSAPPSRYCDRSI